MNVVIYARFSSDKQNEQSITGQLRICHDYAVRMGYTVIGEYCDRAISGTKSENRYEFLKMIKDSEKRKFDAVIVYKLDRFARNRYDSAKFRMKLKANNVKVLSAMENISDSPEGVLMESLLEGMAEYYSLELSQKVKRGIHDSAVQCKHVGSTVPFGYLVTENKDIVLHPTNHLITKAMFDEYASGDSIKDILKKYNDLGYRHEGRTFTKNKINRMLQNERYLGIYIYSDVRIEGGIPAIVDQATFDLCQDRLKRNKIHSAKNKTDVDYILSTRIFCGECGSAYYGEYGTGRNGTKHFYYKCCNRKSNGGCSSTAIKKDVLERNILQVTNDLILKDKMIKKIADRVVKLLEKENGKNVNIKVLEQRIKETDKSIGNLVSAIEMGAFSKSTGERLRQLEAEREDLQMSLDMEVLASNVPIKKEDIIMYMSSFKNFDIDDSDVCKKMVDLFIHSVYIMHDGNDAENKKTSVVIKYNTSAKSSSDLNNSIPDLVNTDSRLTQLVHQRGQYSNIYVKGSFLYLKHEFNSAA